MARYADMAVLDAYYESIDLEDLIENAEDEEQQQFNRRRMRKAAEASAHMKDAVAVDRASSPVAAGRARG